MSGLDQIWADPRLVYTVAVLAVALLVATIWLFRRQERSGRGAGVICLILSILLHAALLFLVPMLSGDQGGSASVDPEGDVGVDAVSFSAFDPELNVADVAGDDAQSELAPLPVAELTDLLSQETAESLTEPDSPVEETLTDLDTVPDSGETLAQDSMPESLQPTDSNAEQPLVSPALESEIDQALEDLLATQMELAESAVASTPLPAVDPGQDMPPSPSQFAGDQPKDTIEPTKPIQQSIQHPAPAALVPGALESDFANRTGAAKNLALQLTGGSMETEAAVKAALRYLTSAQRIDGAWDPTSTGAGVERKPLGESRAGAGTKCETGITGLALLALMGAGHTHHDGEYADNVFRGLAYLIQNQKADGSLSGNATIYAGSYCHSMAALALCEAAALTKDPSAIEASRRAIGYSMRMQHPTTGGWRYTAGDPGDLSQLGWQAMVLDAGVRAGISVRPQSVAGLERFLKSVQAGRGGLASYRPGEAVSRTMTAEALATRLMIGNHVPQDQVDEAERYLLQELPGKGRDNYYYWYYATLALHQLQDSAWQQWNAALQDRLLATQRRDGDWPTNGVWAGYGGSIYSTSMATLCLESYYRHAVRTNQNRITQQPRDSRTDGRIE
ncbi:prenyltransferase/squalene oxidase repeat-containing protein [Stieleria varia]|uniref:Squalene cyclase C-terminal domain-containing protein n=1 Tax=Stieleria varia TaxID=2528005 RepID=A0A5C6AZC9_9BACT|nr:prenyltransferase/squalene oxidase repeat-containing protein [Stieleria varia]TWU04847.1 hypothetical protein Pla52n_28920 [Stieleria varia]